MSRTIITKGDIDNEQAAEYMRYRNAAAFLFELAEALHRIGSHDRAKTCREYAEWLSMKPEHHEKRSII